MFNSNSSTGEGNVSNLRTPVPKRPTNLKLSHSANNSNVNLARNAFHSPLASNYNLSRSATPLTPRPNPIEQVRLEHYNLDFPSVTKVDDICDPDSRFYCRVKPRTLNLPKLLPYEPELPLDQSRYLSHIISHLYIAIKSLDINGVLSVSPKDLEKLKLNAATGQGTDAPYAGEDEDFDAEFSENDSDESEEEDDDSDEVNGEDDVEDDMSREIFSGIGSAASSHNNPNSSIVVSVRHWTNELRTWIKMKNDLPFDLRIVLARVYYTLCLVHGQSIPLSLFVRMFILLTKYEPLVLKERGLVLDYKPLFDLLDSKFPQADAAHDKIRQSSKKHLLKLGIYANYFFPEEVFDEAFSLIGSRLSLNTAFLALACYFCILPMHSPKILDVTSSFFHVWTGVSKIKGVDSHLTNIFGTSFERILSELYNRSDKQKTLSRFGKYGFLEKDQLLFVFSQLLNSLNIQPHIFGISSSSNFYYGYANIIVFSINGDQALDPDNGLFIQLETLVNTIETYLHPSNTDVWTDACTKLIQDLILQFHRRYVYENDPDQHLYHLPAENKISKATVVKFVKLLLPKVLLGLQSKKSSVVGLNVDSVGLLCDLEPKLVLNVLLLDIYESLQSVISNHRLTVSLKLLTKLSKYFVTQKVFRCHVTRILGLVLPGIDSNDLGKTLLTLNVIASFASYLPFYDLSKEQKSNGTDELQFVDSGLAFEVTQTHLQFLSERVYNTKKLSDDAVDIEYFELEDEYEEKVVISSSSIFEDFLRMLISKVCSLLENLSDQSMHQSNSEVNLETALPRTLLILFESMSDPLFKIFSDRFLSFINENALYNSVDLTAEIIGTIIKHNPEEQTPKFMDFVLDKVNDQLTAGNAGKVRSGSSVLHRDKPLFCYLAYLSEIIRYAGENILAYSYKLTNLSRMLLREVKGPIMYGSAFLVTQTLKTLSTIRLEEHKLISPTYIAKHGVTEKCWGGFYDKPERLDIDNLEFKWHVPDRKEIEFAVQFFGEHVNECFKNLDDLMQNSDGSYVPHDPQSMDIEEADLSKASSDILDFTDNFRKNLLYLSHASTGISYLLDPAYQEKSSETSKSNKLNTQLLDKRLRALNLSQRSLVNAVNTDEGTKAFASETSTPQTEIANGNNAHQSALNGSAQIDDLLHIEHHDDENDVSLSRVDSTVSLNSIEQVSMSRDTSIGLQFEFSPGRAGDHSPADNSLNPAITERAQKLYTSNYFFGNTKEERQKSDLYQRVHSLHKQIGQKLHEVCHFLMKHYANDVKLFRVFLHTVQTWFCDFGAESSLKSFDDNFVTYKYLKGLQDTSGYKKLFTRMSLGARIERYHRQRVVIHAGSRFQTKLDKILLDDIITLSMSIYSAISQSAQEVLDGATKKLVGSYGILIDTVFKHLETVIKENDYKKVKSALKIFTVGRLKNRIYGDYRNVAKYAQFLLQCMNIDDQPTNEIANRLYKSLSIFIKIPSSICIFDEKVADLIKPPDFSVDMNIKLLRLAKEKKRHLFLHYLKKLQDLILSQENTKENHWKVSVINMELLINLQIDFEVQTNADVIELLVKRARVAHPAISGVAISGLTRLFSKIIQLSNFSYNIRHLYDVSHISHEMKVVNTNYKSLNHNYSDDFFKELKKTENCDYYIDNKIYRGWLFWDKELIVVKNESFVELNLKKHELLLLEKLSPHITKEWFADIIKLIVEDNEEGSKFRGNHIFLIVLLIHLISAKVLKNITYQDLIDIVRNIYVRDEKSAHVVTCEMICGFVAATKNTSPEYIDVRDEFISETLTHVLKDLSPDNNAVWKIFSWWLPTHTDLRRYASLFKPILDYRPVPGEETPFLQATRLSCLKSCLASITWKYRDSNQLIEDLMKLMLHPYQAVRDQISSTITIALYGYFNESYPDSVSFIEANKAAGSLGIIPYQFPDSVIGHIVDGFKALSVFRSQIDEKNTSTQDVLNSPFIYGTRTIIGLLKTVLRSSASLGLVDLIPEYISPFLLNLENMREACKLASINPAAVYLSIARVPFRAEQVDSIVKLILNEGGVSKPSWHQRLILLTFTEIFYFRLLLLLSPAQRHSLFEYVSKLVFHSQLEVREAASNALSGMIHCSPTIEREEVIKKCINNYAAVLQQFKKMTKKKRKTLTSSDGVSLHGATLGLGSLVSAFPYLSPPPEWFPNVLGLLANNAFGLFGIVDKTSKGILSNFKKTRQDTWHIDSKVFSEEQLEDLEGVLRESYFV